MIALCPHCGFDLEQIKPIALGDLEVAGHHHPVRWKGSEVRLTPAQWLMVTAIARANGHTVSRYALAEAMGVDGDTPDNIVAVQLTKAKAAFRVIDPAFDAIKTVRGFGLMWAA